MPSPPTKRSISGKLAIDFVIEGISLTWYFIVFCFVVGILGLVYFELTPINHGMGQGNEALKDPTYWQGLYFSIVTVSSLGYGDIHPMGVSRALVCFEVLFGLTFMGIVVAKITSRRLTYHVQRLFSSDAQRRLDELASQFESIQHAIPKTMKDLSAAFQEIPGAAHPKERDRQDAVQNFDKLLDTLFNKSAALADYLSHEVQQGGYFSCVPVDAIRRVAKTMEQGLYLLGQLIIGLSAQARAQAINQQMRGQISEVSSNTLRVCDLIDGHSEDTEAKNYSSRIRHVCNAVLGAYYSTPVVSRETAQPDQALQSADQPQEGVSIGSQGSPERVEALIGDK